LSRNAHTPHASISWRCKLGQPYATEPRVAQPYRRGIDAVVQTTRRNGERAESVEPCVPCADGCALTLQSLVLVCSLWPSAQDVWRSHDWCFSGSGLLCRRVFSDVFSPIWCCASEGVDADHESACASSQPARH